MTFQISFFAFFDGFGLFESGLIMGCVFCHQTEHIDGVFSILSLWPIPSYPLLPLNNLAFLCQMEPPSWPLSLFSPHFVKNLSNATANIHILDSVPPQTHSLGAIWPHHHQCLDHWGISCFFEYISLNNGWVLDVLQELSLSHPWLVSLRKGHFFNMFTALNSCPKVFHFSCVFVSMYGRAIYFYL